MPGETTFILDGIWGRASRFNRLRRALEQTCGPTEIFTYVANGTGCLRSEGRRLADALKHHGQPVNLLAFSMGGLVVRAAHAADPSLRIRRAVFLNTPHAGSWWCYLARPFSSLRSLHQMRPGSDLLRDLDSASWRVPTLVTWCPFDLFVFPGSSARWARSAAQSLCCLTPLHEWPMYSRAVRERVVRFFSH